MDLNSSRVNSQIIRRSLASSVPPERVMSHTNLASVSTKEADKGPYVQQTIDFLDAAFGNYSATSIAFRFWNGKKWEKKLNGKPSQFTIVLNHAASLRRMFVPPSDSQLGLAYTLGDFDIEGEAEQALYLGKYLWKSWGWSDMLRSAVKLIFLPSSPPPTSSHAAQLTGTRHSQSRDKDAIQFHYDVSNDFYKLWLDTQMVYSCAYFSHPSDSIDVAQTRKLDLICRKLRLQPGERLLDIGCGWGALVIHAAQHYGVFVTGVTLSEKQVKLARERVASAGLADRCEIELLDYREVDETVAFDKIVSIGMVEHVGRENVGEYFAKVGRLLRPGGMMLNHGITLLHDAFVSKRKVRDGFFAKYIFPDGDLQPMPFVLQFAVEAGFEVRDLESLREHYALTLRCWRRRFEERKKEIVDIVGEESFRLWRLYLLGAGWGFASGMHSVYQMVLYKQGSTDDSLLDLPLTREGWYKEGLRKE